MMPSLSFNSFVILSTQLDLLQHLRKRYFSQLCLGVVTFLVKVRTQNRVDDTFNDSFY